MAARAQHIDRLLADFRLERVKIGLVAGEDWVGSDLCAACTVAIRRDPSRPQRSLVQRFGDKCPNDLTQDGRVFSLERDALELPAAADAYFLRLFEHFPDLIVAQHPLLTPSPDLWPGALATGKSARLDAVVTHLPEPSLRITTKRDPDGCSVRTSNCAGNFLQIVTVSLVSIFASPPVDHAAFRALC